MAEKNIYTNAKALAIAVELIKGEEPEIENFEQFIAKLEHMASQAGKPRKKSTAPTKTQLQNQAMLEELLAVMPTDEPVGTDWVMEHVRFVTSPQKASTIVQLGIKAGKIAKTDPEKGKTRYVRI